VNASCEETRLLFCHTTAALQPLLQQRPVWAFAGNTDSGALELVAVSQRQQARHYTILDPNAADPTLDRNYGNATAATTLGLSEWYNASLHVLREAVAALPHSASLRVHLARELVDVAAQQDVNAEASEPARLFESAVELAPHRFSCVCV